MVKYKGQKIASESSNGFKIELDKYVADGEPTFYRVTTTSLGCGSSASCPYDEEDNALGAYKRQVARLCRGGLL